MGSKTLCEWRRHEIPTDLKALRKISPQTQVCLQQVCPQCQ